MLMVLKVGFCGPDIVHTLVGWGRASGCEIECDVADLGSALVAQVGHVVMVMGGGLDNTGGHGLVRGGGPIPSLQVPLVFVTEIFHPRGHTGRPVSASAIVGSLNGGVYSRSQLSSVSLRNSHLRDIAAGKADENEAGINLRVAN